MSIQNQGNINFVITTEAIRRVENVVVDRVETNYDIQDMSKKIGDSQTANSLMPFDWKKNAQGFSRLPKFIHDYLYMRRCQ